MRIPTLFIMLISLLAAFPGSAEKPISDVDHILKPLVGKRVMAEGLAWGAMSKGLGERLVLPCGVRLYFMGTKFREQHKNGRTVRVIGRLKIETEEPAPPGAQGYTTRFQYYALEVESLEVIDEVQYEFPKLAKE